MTPEHEAWVERAMVLAQAFSSASYEANECARASGNFSDESIELEDARDAARAALREHLSRLPIGEPAAYGYRSKALGLYGLSLQPGGSYTEPDRVPLYLDPAGS